jgi:hypothetical protein
MLISNKSSQSIQANDWSKVQNLKLKTFITETSSSLEIFSEAFKKFIFSQTTPSLTSIPSTSSSTLKGTSVTQTTQDTIPGSVEGEGSAVSETTTTLERAELAVSVIWGNIYFIDETTPETSVRFYNELTSNGIPGLFITRLPAEKASEQWTLTESRIIWLCSRSGKDTIPPALEKISHRVYEFVQHNENSIIFLDGVEYIINNNDFLKTLSLLDNLKEIVAINKSVLVFPISSSIFSEKEMTLLGKNAIKINSDFKLDLTNLSLN